MAPVRKSGGLTTSLIRFMFGSRPSEVVKTVSPRRRTVRSNVTNTFR